MPNAEDQGPFPSPLEAQAQLWQAGAELAMAGVRFMSAATAMVMSQTTNALVGGATAPGQTGRPSYGSSAGASPAMPYVARGAWREQGASAISWPFDGILHPWLTAAFNPLPGDPARSRAGAGTHSAQAFERMASETMVRTLSPWLRAAVPPAARPFVTPWLPRSAASGPADAMLEAWAEAVMAPMRERWMAISIEAWSGGFGMPARTAERPSRQAADAGWPVSLPWTAGMFLAPWLMIDRR